MANGSAKASIDDLDIVIKREPTRGSDRNDDGRTPVDESADAHAMDSVNSAPDASVSDTPADTTDADAFRFYSDEHQTATLSPRPSTQDTVVLRKRGESAGEIMATQDDPVPRAPTMAEPSKRPSGALRGQRFEALDSLEALSREQLRSASHVVQRDAGSYTVASPGEAMWQNELARYHHVINVVLGVVTASMLTLPFLEGSAPIKGILYVSMAVLAGACMWQRVLLETPERVKRSNLMATWLAAAVTTCAAVAFFGIYSPAPILMALEVLLVGMTNDRVLVFLFYGIMAVFTAIIGVLVGIDIVADPGLIHADYLDQRDRVLGMALVECVLLGALWIGLSTRREIMASFEKLQHATRLVAQQQAMMREVRQELKRAANIGGHGPLTGEVLGSFELGVLIGRGGMGEVYRAVHTESQELAAVKVLQASAMAEPGASLRFAREVSVACAIEVPNIVRVLEVGSDSAMPYLAMEYLRGQDLARYLRRHSRLSTAKVIKLVREVGAGIHAAGQAGIVHRDIKPHNLFLADISTATDSDPSCDPDSTVPDQRRIWKILDFGVATLASHSGTLTQGRVIGTPAYMAPEQARGRPVDHRADLYALASIVYRALTGHPPYSGDDLPSLLYRVVHEMPRRPSELAELPAHIDAALAIGMAKEPAERFQTADELVDTVCAALESRLPATLLARADALDREHPWR